MATTILFALALISAGDARRAEDPKIAAPDLSDGVDVVEANSIADRIFARFVGCGAHGDLHFVEPNWEVDTYLGYGATPGPTLLIHANSGVTSWGPNCISRDPRVLFDSGQLKISCSPPAA